MTFQQQLERWQSEWSELLKRLQQKGADIVMKWERPATESQLIELEQRLGVLLPTELRQALLVAAEAWMCWTLPPTAVIPFDANGDWGWSLQTIDWLDLWMLEAAGNSLRYLAFYEAHNGDSLVLDMQGQSASPAVLSWNHETGEFRFLAGSLQEFLERIHVLYGIGAESWQYEPFTDYSGLNVKHPHTAYWRAWMHDYLHLTLAEARHTLERLIRYTEVSGAVHAELRAAFDAFAPERVLQAWQERIRQESDRGVREALLEYAGDLCGAHAADWVRSLWQAVPDERINASILAYLTARCLPEQEGLELVLSKLEQLEDTSRLNGYTANAWLKPFHSRKVIEWMSRRQRVSYPYDGWDQLFAISAPAAQDVVQWLNGSGVQRQVAITALARFADVQLIFNHDDEVQHTRRLLECELEQAVTKKEKKLIGGALLALDKVKLER
ncbi:SMI1/KNR4 family protein [Paenibacillus campi]|uniref:SMI1/KNR4 family protein n=1 Tax=Paenibacillus campi TaxID=3106031 RepID=UPI002AFDCFF2|nr:SMI1/KNR4 family protein [Paenibacillus sp. SGZ-1014]